ncbi:uncharacterized protein LOC123014843 [Tribolium madens]|uniref:uncharacterized protein LOC123014843 n=1 Tax=Tribolium madens TaxID=41895 RepID=UPI001CF753C0|nr:uncharacterized protein LOC123014843 [Tribolium madens]
MSALIKLFLLVSISTVICGALEQVQDPLPAGLWTAFKRGAETSDRRAVKMMLGRVNRYASRLYHYLEDRMKSDRAGRAPKSASNFANKVICFPRGCIDISDVGIHP